LFLHEQNLDQICTLQTIQHACNFGTNSEKNPDTSGKNMYHTKWFAKNVESKHELVHLPQHLTTESSQTHS